MKYAEEWAAYQANNPSHMWDHHFVISHLQKLGFKAGVQTFMELSISEGPLSIFNGLRWRTGEAQYGYNTSDLRDGSWAYLITSEVHFRLMELPCANTTDEKPESTTIATQKES